MVAGSMAASGCWRVSRFCAHLPPAARRRGPGRRGAARRLGSARVDVRRAAHAAGQLRDVAAYVELHIEQGPVPEEAGLALGSSTACMGSSVPGSRSPAGPPTPGRRPWGCATTAGGRRPARARSSRVGAAARRRGHGGRPRRLAAIPTGVPADVTLILDQRHGDADGLAAMLGDARRSAAAIASDEGRGPDMRTGAEHDAVEFDARLVAVTCERVQSTTERWRFT